MPTHEPFPWDEAMALGFGILRLAPRDFWAMTPRELARAADGAHGRPVRAANAGLSRTALGALMQTFPDALI